MRCWRVHHLLYVYALVVLALVALGMLLHCTTVAAPLRPTSDRPYAWERVVVARGENHGVCETVAITVVNPTSRRQRIRVECGLSIMSYMDFMPHERAQYVEVPADGQDSLIECFESQYEGRPPCEVVSYEEVR
jgi:hypothetical protein